MENQNFLQRPGGLGPAQKLKPLGGLGAMSAYRVRKHAREHRGSTLDWS